MVGQHGIQCHGAVSDQSFHRTCCKHCGQHIEFPEDALGSRVACPGCEQSLVLGEDPIIAASEPRPEELTAGELKAALEGTIPRRKVSLLYQFGLLLVAIFMVLLPIAYLCFIAGVIYGVYWYAFHGRALLFSGPTGGLYGIIFRVILYIGPLLGGLIAVFFMFKPILARPRKGIEPIELNPAEHPRLYQFIAHVSDALQVSIPGRIYLDCELNAGAGLRRGLASFFGNDLMLVIGLPLVAGLNTRQLSALIAHELGHCTQGLAMRLGYVIDRVDRWFVRVVYGRDSWDDAFEEWAGSIDDWRLEFIVLFARAAIRLSRAVLSFLLHLGHAASCFLSRQMEYHADACSIELAGSACVETLLLRLRELNLLQHLAYNGLNQLWQKRRQLPDSLPDFLTELEKRMPEDFHEQASSTLLNETAGWFATHPTPAQRIRKARQRSAQGIFTLEKPARVLFNDFTAAAKAITTMHYRQILRLPVTDRMLKPANEFV
jgi:Zn-dependent protease with chaperone function